MVHLVLNLSLVPFSSFLSCKNKAYYLQYCIKGYVRIGYIHNLYYIIILIWIFTLNSEYCNNEECFYSIYNLNIIFPFYKSKYASINLEVKREKP